MLPVTMHEAGDAPAEIGPSVDDLLTQRLVDDDRYEDTIVRTLTRDFVRLLRTTRIKAGLSQAEVAAKMGSTQSRVSNLERSRDASIRTICTFLVACGRPPTVPTTVGLPGLRRFLIADPTATPTQENLNMFSVREYLNTKGHRSDFFLTANRSNHHVMSWVGEHVADLQTVQPNRPVSLRTALTDRQVDACIALADASAPLTGAAGRESSLTLTASTAQPAGRQAVS